MRNIPHQLQSPEFRFVRIKNQTKVPFEKEWTTKNNYPWNAPELKDDLEHDENYGVLCGSGGLIVIDVEAASTDLKNIIEKDFPETFKVKTGGGGTHFYYLTDDAQKKVLENNGTHFGEIQGRGSQVVGVNSLHPNGTFYGVLDDKEIAFVKREDINTKLDAFIPKKKETPPPNKDTLFPEDNQLSMANLVNLSGFDKRGDEYQGVHPVHGSTTGMNFCVNPSKNVWHCFRHDCGGSALNYIAMLEGIISCGDDLRGEAYNKTIDAAIKKYGLKLPSDKEKEEAQIFNRLKKLVQEIIIAQTTDSDLTAALITKTSGLKVIEDYGSFLHILEKDYGINTIKARGYINGLEIGRNSVVNLEEISDLPMSEAEIEGLIASIPDGAVAYTKCDKSMTFKQIVRLMNYIWSNYNRLIFLNAPNTEIRGKIINKEWEGRKKIPLAYGTKKELKNDMEERIAYPYTRIFDRRERIVLAQLNIDFFGYRFYDETNQREIILLSEKKLEDEEIENIDSISGMYVDIKDEKTIGSKGILSTYSHLCHVSKTTTRTRNIYIVSTLYSSLSPPTYGHVTTNVVRDFFFPFRHPEWFEKLIIYIIISGKLDYPLHLLIINKGSGGKTTLYERIADIMGIDNEDIWDGEQSTLRSLIPNFKFHPPDCGFLARQKHIGLLDEFFGRQFDEDSLNRASEYATMKTIFEHKHRKGQSGMGSVNVVPTAQFWLNSNPKFGISDISNLQEKADPAFIQRLLIYFMNSEHFDFIEQHRISKYEYPHITRTISNEDFKTWILWCKSFLINVYDKDRIRKMRKNIMNILPVESSVKQGLQDYVDARLDHHMICLLDGITKFRCCCSGIWEKEKFVPNEDDYIELETLMNVLSMSWVSKLNIMEMALDTRVRLLRGMPKEIYHFLRESGGKMLEEDMMKYLMEQYKGKDGEIKIALQQLYDWDVLINNEGYVLTYWMFEKDEHFKEMQEKRKLHHEVLRFIDGFGGNVCFIEEIEAQFGKTQDTTDILKNLMMTGKIKEVEKGGFVPVRH